MSQVILLAENVPANLSEFFEVADVERERGSVLKISSQGYPGAHFATFPPKLIQPMILAGTSEAGACSGCGAPWERVVEETTKGEGVPTERKPGSEHRQGPLMNITGSSCAELEREVKTIGWAPSCACRFYRLRDDTPKGIIEELKSLGLR